MLAMQSWCSVKQSIWHTQIPAPSWSEAAGADECVRMVVKVMDAEAAFVMVNAMPRPFDPRNPRSLLGCTLSEVCPQVFTQTR